MKVDNAIIMAAGSSSRFAPLSYEQHKAMTSVRGEVLIERQIQQLREAGIPEIIVVTGYKAEQFEWLKEHYHVRLVQNAEYLTRNNNGSIWTVRQELGNSYICSSDNYFTSNPFEKDVDESYYAAEYAEGSTAEWCMTEDSHGYIDKVSIGGEKAWYMMGHTFWSSAFSRRFLSILEEEYDWPETRDKLWETIFMSHLDVLKMKVRKYAPGTIFEFDTLDELRCFDPSYVTDTRSQLLKKLAVQLGITEQEMGNFTARKGSGTAAEGFAFDCPFGRYEYLYVPGLLQKL